MRCRRCGQVLTAPQSVRDGIGDCCRPARGVLGRIKVLPSSWWEWTGSIAHEYGVVRLVGNKQDYAHRLLYRMFRGPIPKGRELHHHCSMKRCVNPWHLQPMTRSEHMLMDGHRTAVQIQRTHCPKGHEYTQDNTLRKKNQPTKRECKQCTYERNARNRQRRRQERQLQKAVA